MVDDNRIESEELHEYRLLARKWLRDNVRPLPRNPDGTTQAVDRGGLTPEKVASARLQQRILHEAGYAGFTYPKQYGGLELTYDHQRVFLEEATVYDMPTLTFSVSLNILGPTLLAFGTEEQKATHIPRMLAGEEIWMQLLSEPSGGSDLAGLLTRATRFDDSYVLNGQKTWSTGAMHADFALCPARTRWDVPKHHGISMFIVDLNAPGVEKRRIRQINDEADFCEEFFTEVVVPESNLVGNENDGWRIARGLLEIEHSWVGRSGGGRMEPAIVDDLVAMAHRRGLAGDAGIRRAIASLYAAQRVHALTAIRVSNALESGKLIQGYGGILKLGAANNVQRRAELGLALAGSSGVAWPADEKDAGAWSATFLTSRSSPIAGGTNEVQRNNVAERGLGLPRELSSDRDLPFNEVPKN
jgi:alkylation response protein AidB-like acyl-CoA dehydrogenase